MIFFKTVYANLVFLVDLFYFQGELLLKNVYSLQLQIFVFGTVFVPFAYFLHYYVIETYCSSPTNSFIIFSSNSSFVKSITFLFLPFGSGLSNS